MSDGNHRVSGQDRQVTCGRPVAGRTPSCRQGHLERPRALWLDIPRLSSHSSWIFEMEWDGMVWYVLSVCPSVCLSVRPSVRLSVRPSVCLSVCLCVCLCVCLSACLPGCLSVCMYVRMYRSVMFVWVERCFSGKCLYFIYLFIHLFIYLFIYLSIYIYIYMYVVYIYI